MIKNTLKNTLDHISSDLPKGTWSMKGFIKSYLYSPSFRVLLNHRIGKHFYFGRGRLLRQISNFYKYKLIAKRSNDISYYATIGKSLRLPHPIGIVIGKGVVIGNDVKIFQHVTLGSHGKKGLQLKYPNVKDKVVIYSGATIVGDVTIGENSIVGAKAFVNINVPANSVAFGIPCKIKSL